MMYCSDTLLYFIYTVFRLRNSKILSTLVQLALCMCVLTQLCLTLCDLMSGSTPWNPLQYSCLKYSMDLADWWATIHGVTVLDTMEQLSSHMHNVNCTKYNSVFEFLSFNTVYMQHSNVCEQHIMKLQ